MGRGGQDEGEIAFLDADRISDHSNKEAPDQETQGFGHEADDRAIGRITERLRTAPSSRGLDIEAIEDRAIDLYNRSCEIVRSGKASPEQINKIAGLFGEEPDVLVARLRLESSSEDLTGSGGAGGLLRALGQG